jgi:hypothetical protein
VLLRVVIDEPPEVAGSGVLEGDYRVELLREAYREIVGLERDAVSRLYLGGDRIDPTGMTLGPNTSASCTVASPREGPARRREMNYKRDALQIPTMILVEQLVHLVRVREVRAAVDDVVRTYRSHTDT